MIMRTFYESQGKNVYLIRESRNMEGAVGEPLMSNQR